MAAPSFASDCTPHPVYFVLVDYLLAIVSNEVIYPLNQEQISLKALCGIYKSVVLESLITLSPNTYALIAQFDGADYPSFVLSSYGQKQHEITGLLGNYYLNHDGFTYSLIDQPEVIKHFCFQQRRTQIRYHGKGFCSPIRQVGDNLYILQENARDSRLLLLKGTTTKPQLISDRHHLLVHDDTGLMLQDEQGDVVVWTPDGQLSLTVPKAQDYALHDRTIFCLSDDGVYECSLSSPQWKKLLDSDHDTLLYADHAYLLTSVVNCLNETIYMLYDRVQNVRTEFGGSAPLPERDSISFKYSGEHYSFVRFCATDAAKRKAVMISVYEGFNADNEAIISEFDREHWLKKGHDIICYNALNQIKLCNPALSNTEAKRHSLAVIDAFCRYCKYTLGYHNCILIGVSHGGMMVISSALISQMNSDFFVSISPLVNLDNIIQSDYFMFWKQEFDYSNKIEYRNICPTQLLSDTTESIKGLIISFEGDRIADAKSIKKFVEACDQHNVEHIHFESAHGHATESDYSSTSEGYRAVYDYIDRQLLVLKE